MPAHVASVLCVLASTLAVAAGFAVPSLPSSPLARCGGLASAHARGRTPTADAIPRPPSAEACIPLLDNILVEIETVPSETAAGILLPTVYADEAPDEFTGDEISVYADEARAATVVTMGPGLTAEDGTTVPMPQLTAGQRVIIAPRSGEPVRLEGQSPAESTLVLVKPWQLWGACPA